MAAANAAIRTSKDSLNEHELRLITDLTQAATKRTILRCQKTGKWLQTLPSYVKGTCLSKMEFRDALHLDIVGHHSISSLIAMVVELNYPKLMALSARKEDKSSKAMTKSSELQDDHADRALIPYEVRNDPHNYPGRGADVKVTE